MLQALKNQLARMSLTRQFMLASLVILVAGMTIIGAWVSLQIESGVINQTAGVTALYADSFIAPHLQDLARQDALDVAHVRALDDLMTSTPLGKRIVAFKVWSRDGGILYSTTPALIGKKFAAGFGLRRAFEGQVASHLSNLQEEENAEERRHWSRLLETYAPVRLAGTEQIVSVSEFYQTMDDLQREITTAQIASWVVVGISTLGMYLLLVGIVRRGSNLIAQQQAELRQRAEENAQLSERVRRAAARTTALNERYLRRISADLHDGPGQDLSFALLRLYTINEHCAQCPLAESGERPMTAEVSAIHASLDSALQELRAISAGLRLPELDALSPAETLARATREHREKTDTRVTLDLANAPGIAPLPVKITLYRLVQEALANAYRHAPGAEPSVKLWQEGNEIFLEVADQGPGFELESIASGDGRLGLAGMRERVEILGGTFAVESAPSKGTHIRARLPRQVSDDRGHLGE